MTPIVTGARGQLGQALAEVFQGMGRDIELLSRRELDICDSQSVIQTLEVLKPTALINCAAWTAVDLAESHPDEAFKVNAHGVEVLALACRELEIPLVHLSSDYVFSGNDAIPRSEISIVEPQSVYGRSKAQGETYITSVLPDSGYIVRTAWLYSKFGRNFVKTLARTALFETGRVEVVDDQFGQPTNAMDLASSIANLLDLRPPAGIYHGTNRGQVSWYELAKGIFDLCGADMDRLIPISTDELQSMAQRPRYSVLAQERWVDFGLIPMRDWESAFRSSFPEIRKTLERETA